MTPPSELIRPPSKAAVIFLRSTAGKQNGRRLSSVMAGVACLDPGKGLASATESYARSKAYVTSATPRHEYDGLGSGEPSLPTIERIDVNSGCAPGRLGLVYIKKHVIPS